jgi:asparagine synthase (glutamine-hydrolysing)
MPGIAGIISQRPEADCQAEVASMIRVMNHEPIYSTGLRSIPQLNAYLGWVSIEGGFGEKQVFRNESGDLELIIGGECFLDPEVGVELRRRGHEVGLNPAGWLLHLYEEQGPLLFENLNGLFCGLLVDKRTRKAILFNDRFGCERVYYHERPDGFYFASEAKALLAVCPALREFDNEGIAQYFAFGCSLGGRTLFRGVNILPGAAVWTFDGTDCKKRQYFLPKAWEDQPTLDEDTFNREFRSTFTRVLPRYYRSEHPVGIALTAGLDTRMVLACRDRDTAPVCYTFAGLERDTLDVTLAMQVAAACSSKHYTLRLGPDFFSDFAALSDRTIFITDGTFSAFGAHEIYFNRQARRLAPVRLTGVFGSEVLRGVSTLKKQRIDPCIFSTETRAQVATAEQGGMLLSEHPVTFAAFKEIPWNICNSLAACRSQIVFRTPYLDNELVALAYRAPSSLRKTGASATELIKTSDPSLARIPTDRALLREGSYLNRRWERLKAEVKFKLDYYYHDGMPHWVSPVDNMVSAVNARLGFFGEHKFLNYRRWCRGELASYISEVVSDSTTTDIPFWNSESLKGIAADHIAGRKNRIRELNTILSISAINRLLIKDLKPSVAPLAEFTSSRNQSP